MTLLIPAPSAPLQPDVLQALHHFRVIVRSTQRHFQKVQNTTGLSGSQLGCLAALKAAPGLRVTQLAQALGIQQATASNLIEMLDRRGLVERRRDPRDLRVVHLHLTPLGLDKAQALPAPAAGVLPEALCRLEPATLAALNSLLVEVIGLMKAADPVAGETDPQA